MIDGKGGAGPGGRRTKGSGNRIETGAVLLSYLLKHDNAIERLLINSSLGLRLSYKRYEDVRPPGSIQATHRTTSKEYYDVISYKKITENDGAVLN